MAEVFRLCGFADEASKDLGGQIAALAGNGMDLLEIRGVDGKNVADLTPAEAKETATRLADGGIRVWSVGSPIGKCDISDPPETETDRFMRVLETAVILGAEKIRLFSFYGTSYADAERVLRRLDGFLDRAEGSGVRLCHENEKDIFGDTADRCALLLSSLPRLGGVFDPANYVQCGVDTLDAWKKTGIYTDYCHIKDAGSDGLVVPPGQGDGHLRELLPLFAKRGIGVLTLEPHLKNFSGLAALEKGRPGVGGKTFASGRDAFDYAVRALKKLIGEMDAK